MSEFVKNNKICQETEGQAATHGPNGSAKPEVSKKKEMEDLQNDINAKLQPGQCRYIKPDNSRCEAYAVSASFYCYFHDPNLAEEREAARIKGGNERSRKAAVLPVNTPDRPLETADHIVDLLADTINRVRRGELDHRVSNSIGCLASHLLKAQEHGQLERRLAKLEAIQAQKWANANFASVPTTESQAFEFVKAKTGGEA